MKYRSRYSDNLPVPAPGHTDSAHYRSRSRVRSVAQPLRIPRPADTPLRLALRVAAAAIFITLGQMKFFDSILLGTTAVVLPRGPEGFAQYLAAIGVPFPLLNAYVVCLVEMICGVGLVLSAFLPMPSVLTRLVALPLFFDMVVATLTVGVRNLLGHPVVLAGVPVTHQLWRFPLEFSLLAITLLLVLRPLARRPALPRPSWQPLE